MKLKIIHNESHNLLNIPNFLWREAIPGYSIAKQTMGGGKISFKWNSDYPSFISINGIKFQCLSTSTASPYILEEEYE